MTNKYGLGRGLSSLIPKKVDLGEVNSEKKEIILDADLDLTDRIYQIEVDKIKSNPWQPRTEFDQQKLEDLTNSIREHGIIQPLVVTKDNNIFELIAGERRLKAAKMLNLFKVPVIVRNVDNSKKLELAIIENIQRENLNLLEEAEAYNRLLEEFELTQEQVAKKLGKSRSTVANILRLRNLPKSIKEFLKDSRISFGHAKLLLSLDNEKKQKELVDRILSNDLNVRETENEIGKIIIKTHKRNVQKDPNLSAKEEELRNHLNTKVKIIDKKGRGNINIEYYSREELSVILRKLLNEN